MKQGFLLREVVQRIIRLRLSALYDNESIAALIRGDNLEAGIWRQEHFVLLRICHERDSHEALRSEGLRGCGVDSSIDFACLRSEKELMLRATQG